MFIYLAPAVALVGLYLHLSATNPKVARAGEILFFAGVLVTLMTMSSASFHLK
jgi:hypothetical protein